MGSQPRVKTSKMEVWGKERTTERTVCGFTSSCGFAARGETSKIEVRGRERTIERMVQGFLLGSCGFAAKGDNFKNGDSRETEDDGDIRVRIRVVVDKSDWMREDRDRKSEIRKQRIEVRRRERTTGRLGFMEKSERMRVGRPN